MPPLRSLWSGHWQVPWTIALVGCGVVGRAMLLALTTLGRFDFILVDVKRYTIHHVSTKQCAVRERGRYKAEVLAELARRRGSRAIAFPGDITVLGDGVFGNRTLVVAALDSIPALLATNQLARRMRLPLLRLNTAPSVGIASAWLYATHRPHGACVACGMTEAALEKLKDVPSTTTASTYGCGPGTSMLLAEMAAQLGRHMMQSLLTLNPRANSYWDCEYQVSLPAGNRLVSTVPHRPGCSFCRLIPWENPIFCSSQASSGTLRQVIRAAVGSRERRARIRFCHRLARQAHCVQCQHKSELLKWLPAYTSLVGICDRCGGPLVADSPVIEAPVRSLGSMLDLPLQTLSLPRGAVVSVQVKNRTHAFVFGAIQHSGYRLENVS